MVDFTRYINPIMKDIDSISSFQDVADSPYASEYPYLTRLIDLLANEINEKYKLVLEYQKELEDIKEKINAMTGDDKSDSIGDYNNIFKQTKRVVDDLNRLLDQISAPYFGRVVFDRRRDNTFPAGQITSYIGKFAYFDQETSRALITDWRAPMANLYYMNQGPTKDVTFESPAGIQNGDLKEKTQFDIAMGRITNVYTSTTGNAAADSFLLAQLKRKIGKKLTDIVSTIQGQQNAIIREGIDGPMIIQGVAGSGKTTILLHRIAYLLYGFKKDIATENSLIIAPSKMFLDYISEILPSLGVDQILRNTYLYWAKGVLGWNDQNLISSEPDDLEVKTFKGSPEFIKLVERFISDFEADLFEKIKDPIKDKIADRYYELGRLHPNLSMFEKMNLAAEYAFAQLQFIYQTTGNFMGDLDSNAKRQKDILDYIRKRTNVEKMYHELFKFDYIFREEGIDKTLATKVRDYSLKTLVSVGKSSYYKYEDLAPLTWIYFKIYGITDNVRDYVAVDESQDMSLFQLLTLHKIAKNGNITIAGDLAQSIIQPFYLSDWTQLIDIYKGYFGSETKYHHLDKCYRTTIEVIEFANEIIKGLFPASYKLPEAVLRHGDPVGMIELDSELSGESISSQDEKVLLDLINKEEAAGFATLAIVCRDMKHADKVYENLSAIKEKLPRSLFNYSEEDYHEGILVLPVERAKGLEFDSVIVADMNEKYYSKSFLNAKLFYVAVTRALHRLHVVVNKDCERSSLLK
jgi:DNA helicase-2/ATP-dependent DNA helicase PcrA